MDTGESEYVQEIILNSGFKEAGVIPVGELTYHEDVRKTCEGNMCGCYGTTWACPPAVGSIEECRDRVNSYRYLHLFSKVYVTGDDMDMNVILDDMKDFKRAVRALDRKLKGTLTRK